MKRRIFLIIALISLSGLGLATLSSSIPQPDYSIFKFKSTYWYDWDPQAEEWIAEEYYDVYYSVYNITSGGYGFFNDGPFYPDVDPGEWTSDQSDLLCTYNIGTYARIWVKQELSSSWTQWGDIHMATWNTTTAGGQAYTFEIRMTQPEEPVEED